MTETKPSIKLRLGACLGTAAAVFLPLARLPGSAAEAERLRETGRVLALADILLPEF